MRRQPHLVRLGLSLGMGMLLHVYFHGFWLTVCSGLPFPTWFTRLVVVDSVPLPLNAILASMLFVLVLALLVLGGDQAFNSIVGLLNGAVGLTYVLSVGCVLWRRSFGEPLPPARWSLGKLGIPLTSLPSSTSPSLRLSVSSHSSQKSQRRTSIGMSNTRCIADA